MKKYLIGIALLALVVMASGCTNTNNQTSIPTKNYSAGGISFQYNDTWNINNATQGNQTVIAVTDTDFNQTNGTKGSAVIIVKIPTSVINASGLTLTDTKTNLTTQAQQNGGQVTNSTVNIGGLTANKLTYNVTMNSTPIYGGLIDFEKNNNTFLINFASANTNVETAKANFDVIINSLKVD
jgi:hypothetical protein